MVKYFVSVPELWARTYEIEANSFEEAVAKYKKEPHIFNTMHEPEYVGEMLDQEFIEVTGLEE